MYDQEKERSFSLSHKHTSWKDTEQNIPRVWDRLKDVISSAAWSDAYVFCFLNNFNFFQTQFLFWVLQHKYKG